MSDGQDDEKPAEEEDPTDEASEESFPASDAPAGWSGRDDPHDEVER